MHRSLAMALEALRVSAVWSKMANQHSFDSMQHWVHATLLAGLIKWRAGRSPAPRSQTSLTHRPMALAIKALRVSAVWSKMANQHSFDSTQHWVHTTLLAGLIKWRAGRSPAPRSHTSLTHRPTGMAIKAWRASTAWSKMDSIQLARRRWTRTSQLTAFDKWRPQGRQTYVCNRTLSKAIAHNIWLLHLKLDRSFRCWWEHRERRIIEYQVQGCNAEVVRRAAMRFGLVKCILYFGNWQTQSHAARHLDAIVYEYRRSQSVCLHFSLSKWWLQTSLDRAATQLTQQVTAQRATRYQTIAFCMWRNQQKSNGDRVNCSSVLSQMRIWRLVLAFRKWFQSSQHDRHLTKVLTKADEAKTSRAFAKLLVLRDEAQAAVRAAACAVYWKLNLSFGRWWQWWFQSTAVDKWMSRALFWMEHVRLWSRLAQWRASVQSGNKMACAGRKALLRVLEVDGARLKRTFRRWQQFVNSRKKGVDRLCLLRLMHSLPSNAQAVRHPLCRLWLDITLLTVC